MRPCRVLSINILDVEQFLCICSYLRVKLMTFIDPVRRALSDLSFQCCHSQPHLPGCKYLMQRSRDIATLTRMCLIIIIIIIIIFRP